MKATTSRAMQAGALLALVSLGAAACGGSSSTGSAPKNKHAVTPSYNAALTGIVNPSDKTGGTLNLQVQSDFDSVDPGRTYYAFSWNFQRMYQRTVMAFNPVPGRDGTALVPDIATAKGQPSDGGKTWTYKLKTGLKFQDGSPITSKNVKYAVEREFAQDVITGGPGSYYRTLLKPASGSYDGPYKDKSADHLGLSTIDTPDDSTIVFHLDKPFTDFDYLMALPVSTPVPIAYDQGPNGGAKYQFHVQSTGPYKISSYLPGKSLILVRNAMWSKSTDNLRKALPDKIVVTEGTDPNQIDNQLIAGQADIDIAGTGVQQTAQAKLFTNPQLKKNADNPVTGFVRYISIQRKVPPLDNIHCRKAVMYAADKVALQFSRGGPAGGEIAGSMAPPTLVPFDKSYKPYPSGSDNKGDLAKAKDELRLCGKPNGFTTNIASSNKGKGPKSAQALQEALARVGIKAQLKLADASTYYSAFIGTPSNVHKLGLGLAVAGWGPDYPTQFGFWDIIVDGRNILQSGGNSNYAELDDPVVNGDIDKALAETDTGKQQALWTQVNQQVMNDAVLLPFVDDKDVIYRNPRVTNVYLDQAFGMYDYMNLGVGG